jgi:hypothetical protein
MKKFSFFFAMFVSLAASATVTVTPISADYATKKVTFKVSWTNTPQAPYNNRVWIWIDYCPITGTQPAAAFSPASISTAPTLSGVGSINYSASNTRGFFIVGSTTNAGATVTATLSNAPAGKFNWCVYGSDYPPNAKITKATTTNGTYTLHGTPPFIIDGTYTTSANSYTGVLITSITDKTNCPGIITVPQYASTYTGCGVWVELVNNTSVILYGSVSNTVCTNRYGSGWRIPTPAEMVCICNNRLKLENPIITTYDVDQNKYHYSYWASTSGQRMNLEDGTNCTYGYCNWSGCGATIRCVRSM